MRKYLLFLILSLFTTLVAAQNIDMDQIEADEEFRTAVIAFHQGYHNRAILALERSLGFKPEDTLVRQWLGRAYYHSGYEDAALNQWDNLIEAGQAHSALLSFRDMVERRRGLQIEMMERDPWVELLQIENDQNGNPLLGRPSSVSASQDGQGLFYAVSYGSQVISLFNPNGKRQGQFHGGIDGFSRPFDVIFLEGGNFLVSEYWADRISLCNDQGYRQQIIGETGRGPGQLLGPQFMTRSGEYFYVSDWGNKEIDKYSIDGEFILDFGAPQGDFPGFQGPSGVCLTPWGLAVSDQLAGRIYLFDENGNYLQLLMDRGLESPEGLTMDPLGRLLIADGPRVLAYIFEENRWDTLYESEEPDARILKVSFDENGNLLVPDYNSNNLSVLTELSTLTGGLFLRIDRIESRNYPEVRVECTLEDSRGRPYVGLEGTNFLIREGEQYIDQIEMISAGYLDRSVEGLFLIEDSSELRDHRDQVEFTLMDFLQRKDSQDRFSYLSASETPYVIAQEGDNPLAAMEELWYNQPAPQEWALDTSLRMAAATLIESQKRRVLVFLTSGALPENSFENFGLVELASYLKNNNILFFPLYYGSGSSSEELDYIAEQTGGRSYRALDPQGAGRLLDESRLANRGNYVLSFESTMDTDFGRRYIPLSLEVNYLRKSSRDELGFFAPLDFSPSR